MIRRGENDKVEDAVNKWILQKRSQGQPKSEIVLHEKALIFSEKLGRDPQSKARNFKARQAFTNSKVTVKKCLPTLSLQMILFSNLKL
jgi:hypothetical protein